MWRPTSNRCTTALPGRFRPPIIIRLFDKNLPICFAEPSFANETLRKNDIEHIKTKRSLKFKCEMARVFCKKATRNRFDSLAPAYGQAAWVRFLPSRAFEIMILRIETSINNVFLLPQAYTDVEGHCSQEPSKARLCPNRCQRVPDPGSRYFVPNNEERMGAAWSKRVVQLPFRSRGGGALFDPGRFASGRFHGKNGSRSAGLGHRPRRRLACIRSATTGD